LRGGAEREGGRVGVVVEGGEVCEDVFPAAVVVYRAGGIEGSGGAWVSSLHIDQESGGNAYLVW
jgi:hypothetical protein